MKLLHMYHDIMNLYGDYANILALQRILEKSGEEVVVDRLSLGDEISLADYDFIFIGSGTEKNQKVVLADLMKYRNQIRECIAADKLLLFTGNSFEMLGKTVTDGSGVTVEGLALYNFTVTEEKGRRYTDDIIADAEFLRRPLVGFINKSSMIYGITTPMDTVRFGIGNNSDEMTEGLRDRRFFGTHITGPVLQKNPHFLVYIAGLLLGREPFEEYLTYEKRGYENTLKKLSERM